jgi:hypothetical protein
MKYTTDAQPSAPTARASSGGPRLLAALCLLASLLLAGPVADARQESRKLPSPEKIVAEYLKATGGKKRHAAVRDAVYEWAAASERGEARARTLHKAPASARTELRGADGAASSSTANQRMAWRGGADSPVVTLTDAEAHTAKLRAVLAAGRLVDFRKMKVLARTVGVEEAGGEQAYVVEFSTREGGRARASFGAASKLLLKIADADGRNAHLYGDYRPVEGLLVPHRLTADEGARGRVTYALSAARFNTNLPDSAFDPPADATLDIPALLRDLARNQEEVDKRINDYTFTRRVTKREVNDRGEAKKEKVTVQEVYPVQGYGWVMKLVEEDGRPLSPERAAREEKRVAEELAKAEREGPERLRERREKRERERAKRAEKRRRQGGGAEAADEDEEVDVGISTFLRASEFVSPRRETLRGREAIVFDFRPRPGFRPANRGESLASKLSGVAWVDPVERQVVRLEARLVEGFKIGGGLMASVKPGSAFAFEQTRLPDGVWLPRFSQVNASARVLLFAGLTINETHEFGDYQRFDARTDDGKIDAPEKP